MSETAPSNAASNLPESISDEFAVLRQYWENYLNTAELSPDRREAKVRDAIGILDDVSGAFGKEVMFWGRALHAQVTEDYEMVCQPVFIDNKFFGTSLGVDIVNVPAQEGGNDNWKVIHQINYYQRKGAEFTTTAYLFDYDRHNFSFIEPVAAKVEACFPASRYGGTTEQIQSRKANVLRYAARISVDLDEGSKPEHSAAKLREIDRLAAIAERRIGIIQRDIYVRSQAAYVLVPNESGSQLRFKSVDLSQYAVPARCVGVTSFERIAFGRPNDIALPIHEGHCLAIDVRMLLDDTLPEQIVYIPLRENELEYDLQANVHARQAANQGGQP
jgi:hypothetical protein